MQEPWNLEESGELYVRSGGGVGIVIGELEASMLSCFSTPICKTSLQKGDGML